VLKSMYAVGTSVYHCIGRTEARDAGGGWAVSPHHRYEERNVLTVTHISVIDDHVLLANALRTTCSS
jgi:hypothetical protein